MLKVNVGVEKSKVHVGTERKLRRAVEPSNVIHIGRDGQCASGAVYRSSDNRKVSRKLDSR